MHVSLFSRSLRLLSLISFIAVISITAFAQAQAAQAPAPDNDKSHQPPTSAKINALAHRLLAAGLKMNALATDDLKPWHLKVDFQISPSGTQKPDSGTLEEWSLGPYQWKRVYTGSASQYNGSEWSVSEGERYSSRFGGMTNPFLASNLNLRITRPVVNPLYQAANIKPEYDLVAQRVTTEGVQLTCVSVANPSLYAENTDPDWLFPSMCFDSDLHLRLTVASDTSVQFDDIQMFQGHAVARDVKVIVNRALIAEMKVTTLESLDSSDAAIIKPPKDAVAVPLTIEPGLARPESVYEVGASIPLMPNGFPYRGAIPVPVVIHKDGSVKVNRALTPSQFSSWQALYDSLEIAINKWKFKPYIVDGAPVDVAVSVVYPLGMKPFVPSYDRPKPAPTTTGPDDFSSAYDPKRDPAKDLILAETQASQGHKRILVEVGGNWCSWCRILDKFFDDHADLRSQRDADFVLLKVNMSALNENYPFLSHYPSIPGYPWIFVLDADGKLLTSKNTDDLEDRAGSYSAKSIKEFLTSWKTP
jgi:hypothetical protein